MGETTRTMSIPLEKHLRMIARLSAATTFLEDAQGLLVVKPCMIAALTHVLHVELTKTLGTHGPSVILVTPLRLLVNVATVVVIIPWKKFTCDFTQCADDHIWHKNSEVYKAWMKTADPEGYVETDTPKFEESKSEETVVEESKSAEATDKSTDDTDSHDDGSHDSHDHGTEKNADSSAGIAGHVIGAAIGIFITFFSF